MNNKDGYQFSLLTMMLVFTGISLGLVWWQDHKGLCSQIAVENQNQRVAMFDVQRRIIGFTIFEDEGDYVYEMSEKEEALYFKLSQGENSFKYLVQMIGLWEAAIEDPKNYQTHQEHYRSYCSGRHGLIFEEHRDQHPFGLSVSADKVESFDKFFDGCFSTRHD